MSQYVVIIGPAYPLRGGLSSFNERLALECMHNGFRTEIYTFSLQYPGFLFPGTTQYSTEDPPEKLTIFEKINSVNPLNWWLTGRELRRKKPDLIIVRYWLPFMGPCLGSILRIVKGNGHTRVICIADNIIPHEKRFGDRAFTKYFLQPIDALITMSEKVLNDAKKMSDKPVQQIVHPLYDNFGAPVEKRLARQHLQLPEERPVVLFFGFIRKYKGLDLLLQAIQLLKSRNYFASRDVLFLIAGEFYENASPYLAYIEQHALAPHLLLKTNFIADSEVKYYLSAADCVIQPYRSATQSGVTPLAYHFEIPMLVTNVGGLPALVPPGVGMICEPDAESIATQIEQFFAGDRTQYVQHIQEEKKKYSWEKLVDAIVTLAENTKQKNGS